jgi:hypothetical protein
MTSRSFDTRRRPYFPSPITLEVPPVQIKGFGEHHGGILDHALRERVALIGMDSLVVGIVGPTGLLSPKGSGYKRANQSDAREPPNEHSIYRIASASELYVTFETFIQRDRGYLNW